MWNEIFSMQHQFLKAEGGAGYYSTMQVGSESFMGKLFLNPIIKHFIFNKQMGKAWLKHNIEEVGNLEFFLPGLYEKYGNYERTEGIVK